MKVLSILAVCIAAVSTTKYWEEPSQGWHAPHPHPIGDAIVSAFKSSILELLIGPPTKDQGWAAPAPSPQRQGWAAPAPPPQRQGWDAPAPHPQPQGWAASEAPPQNHEGWGPPQTKLSEYPVIVVERVHRHKGRGGWGH